MSTLTRQANGTVGEVPHNFTPMGDGTTAGRVWDGWRREDEGEKVQALAMEFIERLFSQDDWFVCFYPQDHVGRGWEIRNGTMGAVRLPKILVLTIDRDDFVSTQPNLRGARHRQERCAGGHSHAMSRCVARWPARIRPARARGNTKG